MGTLKDVAPDDLYRGLEHLVAHNIPNHDVVELSARNSTDKVVNPFNNNNNRRLVTLAEHTSDHGRQSKLR